MTPIIECFLTKSTEKNKKSEIANIFVPTEGKLSWISNTRHGGLLLGSGADRVCNRLKGP